ncbi:helix-turn-helix domain-containing protein [Sporosarcina sp. FSL K6-1522]|uniref:helix-turn-helix domain-containing protein n=1 Tax=Sporosarcina sp. FSL K6-1522 TaxID=2921554 RepID=UPI00315A76FE
MENLFVNQYNKKKFILLKNLILYKKSLSIFEISELLNISVTSTTRYIKNLENDLIFNFQNEQIDIVTSNNMTKIEVTKNLNIGLIIDKMRLFYIKSSQEYSVLEALLSKHYPSIEALSLDIHISSSYVYKTIQTLKKILSRFDLKIYFNNDSIISNIVGEERNIRFFLIYIYSHVFKGMEWPFQNDTPSAYYSDFIETYMTELNSKNFSSSQLIRIKQFLIISVYRIKGKGQYIEMDDAFKVIMQKWTESPSFNMTFFNSKLIANSEQRAIENYYMNFLLRFFISDIDSDKNKIIISKKLILEDNPLTKATQKLLDSFLETFNINVGGESYYILIYQVQLMLIFLNFQNIDLTSYTVTSTTLSRFNSKNKNFSTIEKKISEFIRDFFIINKEINIKLTKSSTLYFAQYLFFLADKFVKAKPIMIYIQLSKDCFSTSVVKSRILKFFNTDGLVFTDDIKQADLIVSDNYEENIDNDKFFYFDDLYNLQDWSSLILFINDRFFNYRTYHNSFEGLRNTIDNS